jgi:hypothetical protein
MRIRKDVLTKVRGLKLSIAIGSAVITKTISPTAVEIAVSLRTSDPAEAKLRHAAVSHYVEQVFASLRTVNEHPLTKPQRMALAGDAYRAEIASGKDEPGDPEDSEILAELWAKAGNDNLRGTSIEAGKGGDDPVCKRLALLRREVNALHVGGGDLVDGFSAQLRNEVLIEMALVLAGGSGRALLADVIHELGGGLF